MAAYYLKDSLILGTQGFPLLMIAKEKRIKFFFSYFLGFKRLNRYSFDFSGAKIRNKIHKTMQILFQEGGIQLADNKRIK